MIGLSGRSSKVSISTAHRWKEHFGIGVHRPTFPDIIADYSNEDGAIDPNRVITGSRNGTTTINLTVGKFEQARLGKEELEYDQKMLQRLFDEALSRARKRYRFYLSVRRRFGL